MASNVDRTVLFATVVAGTMIAQQIAGKAARDAFFLTHFEVSSLPTMMVVSALLSIAVVRGVMGVRPAWLMPRAFAVSGLVMIAEWLLAPFQPQMVAIALYLHISVFGSILISGFWSLVTECLDPYSARQRMGRIGTGAVVGAVIGGLLAERVGALFSLTAVLPVLAALHLLCAGLILALKPVDEGAEADGSERKVGVQAGLQVFKRLPYLRNLAYLVLLGAVSAALIDYAFKAQVAESIAGGEAMMRFFALYYTGIGIATLIVQSTLSKRVLKRFGLGPTVASLPASVVVGSLGMLAAPGLASALAARGGEATFRSSLFRSGYELFYSPLSPRDKRATKTAIDVLSERVGDALGGVAAKLLLLLGATAARSAILGLAALLGVAALWICARLNRGYVKALEASLVKRGSGKPAGGGEAAEAPGTLLLQREQLQLQSVLFSVEGGLGAISEAPPEARITSATRESAASSRRPAAAGQAATAQDAATQEDGRQEDGRQGAALDPVARRLTDLRSGSLSRVRRALQAGPLEPVLVPQVIRLLGSDDVARDAARALAPVAPAITGQLGDALIDTDLDFAIRRRVPGVLAAASSSRAAPPLIAGLDDVRFGVRFRCARALARLHGRGVSSTFSLDQIFAIVLKEVKADPRIWEGQLTPDQAGEEDGSSFEAVSLRRAHRRLEYMFSLLSLVLPREPLKIAFRGVRSADQHLKGTALEYLESVLPADIRHDLWPFLTHESGPSRRTRPREEIVSDLLRSSAAIESNPPDPEDQDSQDQDPWDHGGK